MQGNNLVRIGIDLMGSETPPEVLYQAVVHFHETDPSVQPVLFATPEVLGEIGGLFPSVPSPDLISMDDSPAQAVRRKKNSSICLGARALKENFIDAFVSPGNTGALLLATKTTLGTFPGIDRPALLTLLPSKTGEVAVLDVGANLFLTARHLVQFAAMGVAFQKTRGIVNPTIGLLNIGIESTKGTPELKEAYTQLELLNRDTPVFLGNIEGRDVFSGTIDVLVTHGFTGNIFLKTAEGLAAYILSELEAISIETSSSFLKELSAKLRPRLHYAEYPGAVLCGVKGIVVKCHGNCSSASLINSLKSTTRLYRHQFLTKIESQLH